MKRNNRKGFLIVFFVILFLPYLQHRFPVINSGELAGYYSNRQDADFTFSGWFSGAYQSRVNDFYNDQIGFRPDLLRLNAQIDYSLFQKLDYGGTTLGNDNYLY